MSNPQAQPKSDDSTLSIAADFARVLWNPTAVFRRRRTTRARRVLFVLWVIIALLAIPFFLGLALPERIEMREPTPLILKLVFSPIIALVFVLSTAVHGTSVWIGAKALGLPVPMSRAIVIAALSSAVTILLLITGSFAFFATGQASEPPAWVNALSLSLAPLAPENRPVLALLLSTIGVPAVWLAALHAIGARETSRIARSLKFTAPVFWAASAAVLLVLAAIFAPIARWSEEIERREPAATETADTTRAPARAP